MRKNKFIDNDRLTQLFELQMAFNDRLVVGSMRRFQKISAPLKERNKWLLRNARAIIHEAVEVEDECLWKWWSKDKTIDLKHIQIEVVDLWHFLLSLTIISGLDAKKLFALYQKKLALNHKRLDGGYSKKNKQKFSDKKIR